MNRQQISTLLVLKELGIKYRMESFDDRLCVQKTVYLAQAMGATLGHHFNWYLRGPYARGLTGDVFDAIGGYDPDSFLQRWVLDAEMKEKLAVLRPQLEAPAGLDQPKWLELLASVHFLLDRHQVSPSADAGELRERLEKFKKPFSESQIAEALRRLGDLGLLPTPRH